ncbi:uncharacterized protein LOC106179861 [Lingula anatina]|uniref:Uncharacterized protein LOC106179861 n=1 Tax=Lingula anatina TaxID=7574 RepID=A0A1S3K912_LINAN|nr:uncharacterized protein LOC106179861 [Lingula anatina]|eukprot:XP_013419108.1 uncharacterized protein LOC106179861 [Lingula anatina]
MLQDGVRTPGFTVETPPPHMENAGGIPLKVAMISVHGDPLVPNSELGSDGKGGQNVYVREVGKELAKLNCDITWFTRSEAPDQVGVIDISPTLRCQYIVAGPQEHINRDFLFTHLDCFIAQIDASKFDCVFTNYWLSGYVGLRLGRPQLHVHHSLGQLKYERLEMPEIGPTRLTVEKLLNKYVACMVHQTDSEIKLCESTNPVLIKAGINTDRYEQCDPTAARQELGFDESTINVLFAGRFASQKGVPYVIEAMKSTDVPFKFRLIGNYKGSEFEHLVAENPQFDFVGQQPPEMLALYMVASDILIMPSLYEPFGIVAIEGMASKCSLIVSATGGLDEIVEEGVTGLKIPPGDANAIRVAFERLAASPDLRRRLSENAHVNAMSAYSWKGTAIKIRQQLERIVYCNPVPANRIFTPAVQPAHNKGASADLTDVGLASKRSYVG